MFDLTEEEIKLFKTLDTPKKIQDFINRIPINFEDGNEEDTCYSPRKVLKDNKCHCIEGAILAALILRVNGFPPLLVDMTANDDDFDHVIAVFQQDEKWGAISKTNHCTLRYREPVYNSIRELVMSYFHEYTNDDGEKTLRSYTDAVDISNLDDKNWTTSEKNIWCVPEKLVRAKHYPILTRKQIKNLSKGEDIELKARKLIEWKSKHMKRNL